jgi:GNAT superfamily N-acetyltransferase
MTVSTGPMASPRDAWEVVRACAEHDQPDMPTMSFDAYLDTLAHPWPGLTTERHLGFLDGEPVGYLQLTLPQRDNLQNMTVEPAVLPAARRRGVGRALLDLALDRAEALGRKHLTGSAVEAHPDGAAFARAAGATPAMAETRSRLDLRPADQARLDALLADAWAHADGYRLILWTGVPPDEVIDDVAYLDSRFYLDAPIGDLAVEPERVDAAKVRETELCRLLRGQSTYNVGALHGERLVAWTELSGLADQPTHAWQSITLVAREHRGHRLGMLIKLANLAQARRLRPRLEAIDTYNAADNGHMIGINEAMGFRAVDSSVLWQLTR